MKLEASQFRFLCPVFRQPQQRQQEDDNEQRHRQAQRVADDRSHYLADEAGRPIRPLPHSFFNRANGAENEPGQGDDPTGFENRGERADPEQASGPADNAGGDRHQRKRAAAHPQKKCDRFADR